LLVADSTMYMNKTEKGLYLRLTHITRVAYALNPVCETIHVFHSNVNKSVITGIYVKLLAIIEHFKIRFVDTLSLNVFRDSFFFISY
jgi:hypothetical protein